MSITKQTLSHMEGFAEDFAAQMLICFDGGAPCKSFSNPFIARRILE
jgi:hypothetical protein